MLGAVFAWSVAFWPRATVSGALTSDTTVAAAIGEGEGEGDGVAAGDSATVVGDSVVDDGEATLSHATEASTAQATSSAAERDGASNISRRLSVELRDEPRRLETELVEIADLRMGDAHRLHVTTEVRLRT